MLTRALVYYVRPVNMGGDPIDLMRTGCVYPTLSAALWQNRTNTIKNGLMVFRGMVGCIDAAECAGVFIMEGAERVSRAEMLQAWTGKWSELPGIYR